MFGRFVLFMMPLMPRKLIKRFAMRYVAGEDFDSARQVIQNMNSRNFHATLDILGEDVSSAEQADGVVAGYKSVLKHIAEDGLQANISVKLTHLGLRLDEAAAIQRVHDLADYAKSLGIFMRIDMEDSSLTQKTLDIHNEVREGRGNVGVVLQSYLKRTEEDARQLANTGANIRLCKGIYREPPDIAFKHPDEIRQSYLRCAELLLEGRGNYTAFATHDLQLITALEEMVTFRSIPKDTFEFQALLGVPVENTLDALVARGFKVRWYVPFGADWYAYATRRLEENPDIASYMFRQIFSPQNRSR